MRKYICHASCLYILAWTRAYTCTEQGEQGKASSRGSASVCFRNASIRGASRVDGDLAISRAFGDFKYKNNKDLTHINQKITCEPIVSEFKLEYGNILLLCSDGVLDRLSSGKIKNIIKYNYKNLKFSEVILTSPSLRNQISMKNLKFVQN